MFLVSLELVASDDTPRAFYSIPSHIFINSERAYNPTSGIAPISFVNNNLGLTYSNKYLMKETSTFLGFGTFAFKHICLGGFVNYFGNQNYWNSTQSLILAKKIHEKLALGVSFSHTIINQGTEYKAIHQYTPSVGISLKPFPKWKIATVLKNISHNENNSYGSNDFILGISYISKNINIHSQIEKMQKSKTIFELFGEYSVSKKLCILLRTSTGNEPLGIGAELHIYGITFMFLYSYHIYLGSTPELSMYKNW